MPTPHSYYGYLEIYSGEHGEKPRAGAFYIPKYGDTLTKISNAAYGVLTSTLSGVQWINRSQWNRDAAKSGAFCYRALSTSCKAKVVDPDLALTTTGYNKGAWLALCPPYPLFWIPAHEGQMPEDLAPPDDPPGPPGLVVKFPAEKGKREVTKVRPPVIKTRTSPGPGPTSPFYQGQGTNPQRVAAAGIGSKWWLWALLLGAAAAGTYAWSRKKKKKRKRG